MKNLILTAIAASLLASCSTLTSDEAREFQTSMEKANAATQEHADAFYNALNDDFAFYNGATGGLWPKSELTVTPDWFDEDTTYSEFLSTHESGNVVSAFGKGVSKYGMFEINTRFHALYTKEDDGSVNWLRNMAINEHLLAFRWMDLSIKDDDRFSELFQGMARSATTLRFATAAAYSDSLASEYTDYAPAHFGHFLKAWQDNDETGMIDLVESISGKLDNENHAETEWMMGITADSQEMRTYHWQNALNLSPNAPLITVFYSFNQPNVAVKEAVVRRVLERHPGNAGLCNVMGYILMSQDKMEDAKEYFEFNMTFHDDLANSFDSMGDWYAKNGDSENALEMFQKAADMDPDNFTFDASRVEE